MLREHKSYNKMDMKVHKGDYENFDEEELHPEIEINLDRMNDASNRNGDDFSKILNLMI